MNKRSVQLTIGLLWMVLLLCVSDTIAQSADVNRISIKNNTITITANADAWYQDIAKNRTSGNVQALVHLTRLPGVQDRTLLASAGIQLQDYIHGKTYVATIDISKKVSSLPAIVYGFTDVNPAWKLDDILLQEKPQNEIQVLASFFTGIPADSIEANIKKLGASIIPNELQGVHVYQLRIKAGSLLHLAGFYGLQYISKYNTPIPLNFESRCASKAAIASLPVVYGGYGLRGAGVTVGVGDNVSGNFHIDLKDRIINYNPQPYTNHGVHINGIVGGAGIMDVKGEGVAPEAKLIDHLFDAIWQRTGTFFPQYNMTITNNSYAAVINDCSYSGTYNALSVAVDRMSLQYNKVLHVFAAGDDGLLNCTPYPNGFGNVSGGYQPAKDNIVVTSTDKYYVDADDASRGPAKDGRLKPEITAVGRGVVSTTNTFEYLEAGGTSMASPGVAGGLALLTERYKQLNGGNNPNADLLKAVLLNGAMDMGNPGPDYTFGFGFMDVYRSLQMLDSGRYATRTITNGGQQDIDFSVPPNTAQLKVMLYYHDAVANPLASAALVNDLDLQVTEPSSAIHTPLILDPSPANVKNNAKEGVDRLNNVEQVTINNPASGTYTASVKGFNIPSASQDFVIAYDYIPVGVMLAYPTTGTAVMAGDSARLYWTASDNSNSFTLEYSTDGGANWTVISNTIGDSVRQFRWGVPANISSGKCKMRLTRNGTGQQYTTGLFAVTPRPVAALDAVQCPGYIHIKWTSVPSASGYEVMMKKGIKMVVVDTVTDTSYTFSGLSLDSTYYVAARPVIDGMSGYRSLAIFRTPKDGNCTGHISDNDLMVQTLVKPSTGRKLTSTELTANETLSVLVRNLDDVKVDSYRVSYSINAGTWQSKVMTMPIAANSVGLATIPGIDLSASGIYQLRLAVQNLSATDPVPANDSIIKVLKQLDNPPVNIAGTFTDGFEAWDALETENDSIGISPDGRWDYHNENDTCRLRSIVNSTITITGNRSISLDAIYNAGRNHANEFTGTFNMINYDVANDEVRLEFDYILHGTPLAPEDNAVAVRGADTKNWSKLYVYKTSTAGSGNAVNSGSLSITDALQASGQAFTTSTQVDFLQDDKSLISERNYGSGVTIDNVKLYMVQNDIQLLSIVTPGIIECGLNGQVPLVIRLRNGVNQTLNNVQLYYRFDGGPVVNETLSTLAGKQTVDYSFNALMDLSKTGGHTLDVWVAATGDSYTKNDSILNYSFHNQPLVASFPYKETFENGDGNWYTEGASDSWAYGTPASPKINKAASGTKAWKTNLSGNYNPLELSYLYSPCFDVSSLKYPKFRFAIAHDIEDCGIVLCDGAALQYSTDGVVWQRLNDSTQSANWYTDTSYNIWTGERTDWHSVSVKLPKGLQTVRFRYIFFSDQGSEKEGLAVDDVEIFDDIPVPAVDNLIGISPNPTRDGKLNIEWSAVGGTDLQLAMFNSIGRQVFTQTIKSDAGYNKATLNTPHFSSGVYILHIILGDKKYARKIVYL